MPMKARFVPTRKRKDFRFAITAALKLGEKEADPMNGWVPPATNACGWPKADPAAYIRRVMAGLPT